MNPIKMGMPVYATDRKAGRVDDVLANGETGEPAFVVIDAGGFFKGDVVVPFASVQNVTDAGVWLALTRDEVKHAPAYDPVRHGRAAGLVSRAAGRYGED
jgi:uncharacterized protein YrrD